MATGVTLGIVDDHPALLAGLAATLRGCMPNLSLIVTAASVEELETSGVDYSLVLLDLNLGEADPQPPEAGVARLSRRGWPVLLYTQETRPPVVARCMAAGAWGVVGKGEPLDALVEAVESVLGGMPYLNTEWALAVESVSDRIPRLPPREAQALKLYATGLPLKSVARAMGISIDTANEYLRRVRARYDSVGRDAHTRTDLIRVATEDGHIEPIAPLAFPGVRE